MPGKYIYCFIKEKDGVNICSSSFAGIISPVYTMPYQEIAAVVSNTDIYEFDPTRKNILNHQRVVTKVMEKYTVIPVAFGTVGNNKQEIEKIMVSNYDELVKQLTFLEHKSEVGLKVSWTDEYFNQDIESDEIIRLKNKVNGRIEEEVLQDKIQLGKLVQEAAEDKKETYLKDIYEKLSKLSVLSKHKDGISVKSIFTASFLVRDEESEQFDQEVEKIYENYKDKLVFDYTGPWPPYNFVDIRIKLGE